jgi:molybdopterin molybdotransferase
MDGIGVSFDQLQSGQREFTIEGIQAAGIPQKKLQDKTKCMEVMTGAITPEGIDAIIRYEDISINDGKASVKINDFKIFQNIHGKGIDVRKNDVLIEPGQLLSSAEIALLASVGKSNVKVKSLPKISIISTGDELVDVDTIPHLHQIRRSNSYALYAALKELDVIATLHHVADDEKEIEPALQNILGTSNVMILSGGVSKGKFDFVPKALENIGVKKIFHQVSQRPGKPFWFGATSTGKVVFALPGNPVSTYMCFYKYVKPWLFKSLGLQSTEYTAILAHEYTFQPALTYFLQVKIVMESGRLLAYPDAGGGSGDFANLGEVDGFLELPANRSGFNKNEVFPFIPFRRFN